MAAQQALNIAEPEVLVWFGDDPRLQWHHRVLLRRIRESTWVVASPELELSVSDLAEEELLPFARASPVPAAAVGNAHLFRELGEAELDALHAGAERLAVVLGGAVQAEPVGDDGERARWRQADPGRDGFGLEIPSGVMDNPELHVVRSSVGVARIGTCWIHIERVLDSDLEAWRSNKQCGGGRDPRLASGPPSTGGRRFLGLSSAVAGFRPMELVTGRPDWPFTGPRASSEVLVGIRGTGHELNTYFDLYMTRSGLHAGSHVAHELKMLLLMLFMLVSYDHLDVTNLAVGELMCRRVVQLQRAVRANPRAPDFTGLHKMIEHSMDEGGGIATQAFTAHMSSLAEADARILKQNRLLREELEKKGVGGASTAAGGAGSGGGGGGDGESANPNRKKKDGNKKKES